MAAKRAASRLPGRPQRERRPSAETNLLWRNDADPVEKSACLQQRYAEQLSKGSKSGKG